MIDHKIENCLTVRLQIIMLKNVFQVIGFFPGNECLLFKKIIMMNDIIYNSTKHRNLFYDDYSLILN